MLTMIRLLVMRLCLLSWLGVAAVAQAAAPTVLAHQGYLASSGGAAINGTVSMRFALYGSASGGSPLWQETQNVAVQSGTYAVHLGSVSSINLPFDETYYLGISVGSDAELSPRLALSSVPYARAAQIALNVADRSITAAKLGEVCASGQVLAYNGSAWACATLAGGSALPVDGSGNVSSSGYVKLGGANAACSSANAGALRWSGNRFEGCDGNGWTPFAAASCTDGIRNGNESDVDCGGSCGACSGGKTCSTGSNCQSGLCSNGVCAAAPTCSDNVRNGNETDVDCGGSCGACAVGKSCSFSANCQSGVCSNGSCAAPTCFDNLRNGAETDVDCGGVCGACAVGRQCTGAGDCLSGTCSGGVCAAAQIGQCTTAADCPGSDSACSTRTCQAGICGVSFAAAGTATPDQSVGDCQRNVCDGNGNIASSVDNSDTPANSSACTEGSCSNGAPAQLPLANGTAVGGGLLCQGGTAVQCISAADCAGSDSICSTRTCNAGVCGASFAANGTSCGGGLSCQSGACQ